MGIGALRFTEINCITMKDKRAQIRAPFCEINLRVRAHPRYRENCLF